MITAEYVRLAGSQTFGGVSITHLAVEVLCCVQLYMGADSNSGCHIKWQAACPPSHLPGPTTAYLTCSVFSRTLVICSDEKAKESPSPLNCIDYFACIFKNSLETWFVQFEYCAQLLTNQLQLTGKLYTGFPDKATFKQGLGQIGLRAEVLRVRGSFFRENPLDVNWKVVWSVSSLTPYYAPLVLEIELRNIYVHSLHSTSELQPQLSSLFMDHGFPSMLWSDCHPPV